ncbi:MAG: hypothetical protein AAFO72_07385 [Pseudomonadota bacterium]
MQVCDLQGHWQRDWLRAPGVEDRATCVNWMQCGALYADIRIPRGRPETRGATSLADLSDAALLKVLRAEGFAGEISLRGDVCTWVREIDWHGPKAIPDAGRLAFLSDTLMLETGVAADYSEQWGRAEHVADGAVRLTCGNRLAFLVTAGARFVFALGPVSDSAQQASAAALSALKTGEREEDALAAHFDSVYVYGRWHNGRGIAIQATNPLLEGENVLHCRGKRVTFEHMTYHGQRQTLTLQPARETAQDTVHVA